MNKAIEVACECLDMIELTSPQYAKARGERIHLEDYRKVQLAILFTAAIGKTVAEKENWCRAHTDYQQVIRAHANAVEEEAALYWKLKLAEAQIEVWRTMQATRRTEAKAL
mgnify:CR=1 FL=1